MMYDNASISNINMQYNASITREQFLFYEMRTTAKLLHEGLSETDTVNRIVKDNLFQYPTEKSVHRMVKTCIQRIRAMNDDLLIEALATQPVDIAKQICLYAMMKQHRIVWEFMITVIGEKYRSKNLAYGKIDLNMFFLRLQEQDDRVASWSENTITKIKQVLNKILLENEYIDSKNAKQLNPVWLHHLLENAIRSNNDDIVLPAFNYFI